ncbi:MAG: cellulose binding domain-containing protein [Sarcina sp.]
MNRTFSKLKKAVSLLICATFALALTPNFTALANTTKAASSAPGKPTIQHDQYGNDVDGNFNISSSMYYGNNATEYTLYERIGIKNDFTPIASGELVDATPNPQHMQVPITGRSLPGTYYYYMELSNEFGKVTSDTISLKVGMTEMSKIVIDKIDDEQTQNQFTIEQEVTEYKLIHVDAKNPKFSVVSSNTSVANATIINGDTLKVEGISGGRTGLKITEETTGETRHIGARVLNSDKTLPGMPDYLSLGQVSEDREGDLEFWRDIDSDDTNKRMDIRYIYINGGPLTGWRTWTSEDGARAKTYVKESLKLGMIPFFVYYNIPDDAEDYQVDLEHINSKEYMEAYFKDLKFFLDICIEYAGDETVGMIFEPDFLGYMMQQSGKQPDEISAIVDAAYSSGVLEKGKDPQFENNVKGLVEAINYTVEKYYPQAYNGWQFNIWSYEEPGIPSQGLLHKTEFIGWEPGREYIKNAAQITADYYKSAGINSYGTEFISIDKYGLDGAYESGAAQDPESSKWLWNSDIWDNYLLYTNTLHEITEQPVILWQLPVGRLNDSQEANPYNNGKFPPLSNEVGHYEDSAPTFFFGDTFDAGGGNRTEYFGKSEANDSKITANGNIITWGDHMQEAKDSGVISMLFGAGVGASTDAVGSPPADDYWWITKAQRYLQNPLSLDTTIKPDKNPPRKPSITSSVAQTVTGDYKITSTIVANSYANTFELFENGKVIDKGFVTSDKKIIEADFTKKPVGAYEYYIKLSNKDGESTSNKVTVTVVKDEIIDPPVDPPVDPPTDPDDASYDVKFEITQDWGSGANYVITISNTGTTEIKNWGLAFDFADNIQGSWDVDMTIKDGKYTVKPKAWNSSIPAGKSVSFGGASKGGLGNKQPENVKLTGDGLSDITPPSPNKPLKATLKSSTATNEDGKYSVTATLPENHKADSFEIFENGKSIKTGNISSSTIKVDLIKTENGSYEYYLKLTNKNGSTNSNKVKVTVNISGGENPSPDLSDVWKPSISYKIGAVVNYKNKEYKCIQPHLSLIGWEPSNVPSLWQKM